MPKKKQSAKKQARSHRQKPVVAPVVPREAKAPIVRTAKAKPVSPIAAALVLVVIGVIGLMMAMSGTPNETAKTGGPSLEVRNAGSGGTQQSQQGVSSNLQNPAKTNDLIQGKQSNDVQQGTSADSLLEKK